MSPIYLLGYVSELSFWLYSRNERNNFLHWANSSVYLEVFGIRLAAGSHLTTRIVNKNLTDCYYLLGRLPFGELDFFVKNIAIHFRCHFDQYEIFLDTLYAL